MITFNLKKEWFDKIKSGEKTHEYRECKPYWQKRIIAQQGLFLHLNNNCFASVTKDGIFTENLNLECEFVCGYAKKDDKEKRIKAKIKSIKIINGKNTDLAIDKVVYDIEFEVIKEQTNEK